MHMRSGRNFGGYGPAKSGMIAVTLITMATAGILAQNRDNDGKVRVADPLQTLNKGRLGSQPSMPPGPLTLNGILVDGSCADRSQSNLMRAPVPLAQKGPVETPQEARTENAARAETGFATATGQPHSPAVSASGITVDAQTLAREQAEALAQQVPDLTTRQMDMSCAITGRTAAFAFLMDNGRLLNLDGAGNTWAAQVVQSSTEGQAMLNGKGPGVKPRVTIKGTIWGDQVLVESLNLR